METIIVIEFLFERREHNYNFARDKRGRGTVFFFLKKKVYKSGIRVVVDVGVQYIQARTSHIDAISIENYIGIFKGGGPSFKSTHKVRLS